MASTREDAVGEGAESIAARAGLRRYRLIVRANTDRPFGFPRRVMTGGLGGVPVRLNSSFAALTSLQSTLCCSLNVDARTLLFSDTSNKLFTRRPARAPDVLNPAFPAAPQPSTRVVEVWSFNLRKKQTYG